MNRDRRARNRRGPWKKNERCDEYSRRNAFRPPRAVTQEQIREDDEAIRVFKSAEKPLCPHCHEPVIDLLSALSDRAGGAPLHFDCALELISQEEGLSPSDYVAYIGQGRFGIISYENPRDMRHFTIKKIIEWEKREQTAGWRGKIASLYSQVK